jgi:glycosyltransferase involved in cell wall biosynthesis
MGRITVLKGMPLIAAIIREEAVRSQRMGLPPTKFVFAGSGDFEKEVMSIALADPKPDAAYIDVEYRGEVFGMDRAKLVGKARCMLMPTTFVEPFGGSGVEAMLAGTPLIAVDYGAFTETVVNGVNGYRCSTLADWMTAIGYSKTLDRTEISHRASELYSLETCAKQYDRAFRQLLDLPYPGWYAATPHASWAGEDTP